MEPSVEREVELDATSEEVWASLGDAEGWLADEGTLDLRTGSESELTDRGVTRHAVVESVDEGRRLVYRWWGDDDGFTSASRVEITLVPGAGSTRVVVRETPLVANASVVAPVSAARLASRARVGLWWEVRLACLAFATLSAPVRV